MADIHHLPSVRVYINEGKPLTSPTHTFASKDNSVRKTIAILAWAIILSLSACSTPTNISDIRVARTQAVKNPIETEPFPLPNCKGTGDLTTSLGSSASVSKAISIGDRATVRGGGGVGVSELWEAKLEAEVEATYQQEYEAISSRLFTYEMIATPGTHVIYDIVWEEQKFQSIVSFTSAGEEYEVPYTYILQVPKVLDSNQVSCSPSPPAPAPEPTRPPQPQPANSPQAVGCNQMEEVLPHHDAVHNVRWVLDPYPEDRIIEIHSNHHSNNLPVHLYFLPAGKRVEFLSGGGVEYRDRPGCDFAKGEYERKINISRLPIDDAQYQMYIDTGQIPIN